MTTHSTALASSHCHPLFMALATGMFQAVAEVSASTSFHLLPLPYSLKNHTVRSHLFGEGNDTPLQHSCLENLMDGGAWEAAVHGVAKSLTRLSDFTFTFTLMHWRRKLTHSSVFAWRIPGTGEPGGLPSQGSHRVRHD